MRKKSVKVTDEVKEVMSKLRKKGLTYKAIAKIVLLAESTVIYHLDPKYKKRAIKRMMEYQKERGDRTEYMKKYMSERYNEDEEFRERIKKHSREWWRRKHGTK